MNTDLDSHNQVKPSGPIWRRPAVFKLLAIAFFAELAYAMLNISTMPVYLSKDRHFPEGTIGMIVIAFLLSETIFKSPMGQLADRWGRKRLIVIGPAITIFTAIATILVPHDIGDLEVVIFIALRALDGIGVAMLWPAAFALVGETVEEDERQQSMSLLNLCYMSGIGLAMLIGGAANDYLGRFLERNANGNPQSIFLSGEYSPSLYLAAFTCLLVSLVAYITLPSGRIHREKMRSSKILGHTSWDGLKMVFSTAKDIPGYLLLGAVTFIGIGFPLVIIKLFALDQFGMSESQFGLLVLPAMIGMAVFAMPMGRYGEKIGRHKAVHLGLLLCALGVSLISLGAFSPLLRNGLIFMLGGLPLGFGFLLTIPAWYASVSEINEERRAANIGAVMTAQGFGAIIGSAIGSQMYQRLQGIGSIGSFAVDDSFARYSPFLGCAICVLAGWLLSLRLLRA